MKKFTKFTIFFTFFLFIFSNTNVADARPLVAIEVGLTEVNVGEEFMVNIIITDEDIVNMAGWNGFLLFDPTILSLQDAMVGDFIVPNTDFSYDDPTLGIVNMIESGFSRSSMSGQGITAVVNFIALKPGNTLIELSNFAFTDPDAEEILVDIGDNVTVTVNGSSCCLDIDGNGEADALTDGILILRYLFGFRGITLIDGAVAPDCTRCTAPEIEAYLADCVSCCLDIDGNGQYDALTDGILILRYLFGFRGAVLIEGAVAPDCTRCTAPEIEAYIQGLMP